MPTPRVYTHRTQRVEMALQRAPELFGVPETASNPARLEAAISYAIDVAEQDLAVQERVAAYETLAEDTERSERIRRNTRARVSEGLL